jgi:hypothetical protein
VTLIELVRNLDSLDGEDTIYAAEPWAETSEVLVARETPSGEFPPEAQRAGLAYFLEVAIAQEFLADWETSQAKRPSPQQLCARLIQYAVADA